MVLKMRVMNDRYFKGMSLDFDMNKICDRLRFEIYERRIPRLKLAREIGVNRDLIYGYTNGTYLEADMKIPLLKSLAGYFGKEPYYFCNDYHKFLDTVEVGRWLKKLRKSKEMTQRQTAECIGISITRYKSYEQEKSRLPYEVYLSMKEIEKENAKINAEQ